MEGNDSDFTQNTALVDHYLVLNVGDKGQLSLYLGTRWTVSPVFVNGIDGRRLVLDSGDSHGVSRTIYIYI